MAVKDTSQNTDDDINSQILDRDGALRGISVQLYSLREESKDNFDAVLEGLAEQGFDAVEPFNLFGKSPREFIRQVEGLGMQVSSSHFPWANGTDTRLLTDTLAELGLRRAVGGYTPDDVKTEDALKATIDSTNHLVEQLADDGMTLALHNHWWEFNPVPGSSDERLIYHRLQEGCPDVEFELDTYWAANFGAVDVASEMQRIAQRTPLLHIKDGPLVKDAPMVAVGTGKLPVAEVIAAADADVLEWLIVELDSCASDMSTAVGESFHFLDNLLG